MFLSPPVWGKNTYYVFASIDIFSSIQFEILFRCYKDVTPYIINSTSQRIWSIVEWNRKLVMTILISCGYQSVKKMRFQQARRQVTKKLSRKEMVVGESRTMDFTRLSQALKMMSRSIIWKNWSMNGFAIDVINHWTETPTCQDILNLKRSRKYLQEATTNLQEAIINRYLQLNVSVKTCLRSIYRAMPFQTN